MGITSPISDNFPWMTSRGTIFGGKDRACEAAVLTRSLSETFSAKNMLANNRLKWRSEGFLQALSKREKIVAVLPQEEPIDFIALVGHNLPQNATWSWDRVAANSLGEFNPIAHATPETFDITIGDEAIPSDLAMALIPGKTYLLRIDCDISEGSVVVGPSSGTILNYFGNPASLTFTPAEGFTLSSGINIMMFEPFDASQVEIRCQDFAGSISTVTMHKMEIENRQPIHPPIVPSMGAPPFATSPDGALPHWELANYRRIAYRYEPDRHITPSCMVVIDLSTNADYFEVERLFFSRATVVGNGSRLRQIDHNYTWRTDGIDANISSIDQHQCWQLENMLQQLEAERDLARSDTVVIGTPNAEMGMRTSAHGYLSSNGVTMSYGYGQMKFSMSDSPKRQRRRR